MALLDADRQEESSGPNENARFVVNKLLLWLILVPLLIALAVVLFGGIAHGQETANASCLIVKHKGTVGRRLIYFALIGVPIAPGANYDYIDSTNFANPKMSYKGKQLERIQAAGTHVIVLDNFTPEGLAAAHQTCIPSVPNTVSQTGRTETKIAVPESVEHPIEGYTLSGPGSGGSVDGDQTSLGEAARQAKSKKQDGPQR